MIIYKKEEEVQEDTRSVGPTHFLQENGCHSNGNKEEDISLKITFF
jgi:hypothetical protein